MKARFPFFLLLIILQGMPASAASLKFIHSQVPKDSGGEILSYSADGHRVATTFSGGKDGHGVQIFRLTAEGTLEQERLVPLDACFGGEIYSLSSVALDPLGRGLGAAVVIPKARATTKGRLMLFNYRTGQLLGPGLETGYHPDCVNFSKDGKFLLAANEGEFNLETSAPGSLTVVDLTSLKEADAESIAKLTADDYDFRGCELNYLRFHEPGVPKWEAVEPEYVSAVDNKAYVTLQENNGIAVFDLVHRRWTAVHSLGTLSQIIDANSNDKAADISQKVAGLPMPDTIVSFQHQGVTLLATANEGDARPDDFDIITIGTAPLSAGIAALASDERVKHLEISALDGDLDGDGKIEEPTMFGSRSYSLWNAQTGKLVHDSGSLERLLLEHDPTLHNIDSGTPDNFDKRSSKKGPEPEAIAVGTIGERTCLFLGLERQNGILMFDVTTPESPVFAAYFNTIGTADAATPLISPESLVFVPEASSPTGKPLLLVGYELHGGGLGIFEITP
jgi:hypothetical protein